MNTRQQAAFRRNIKGLLKASGQTQEVYAGTLGISAGFLSQILTGERSGERKAFDIANRLGIPICQLITDHNLESHLIYQKLNKLAPKDRKKFLQTLPE